MRTIRILLIAAVIGSLSASARAQEPPSSPHEEARRILRQRISEDEKQGTTNLTTSAPASNGNFRWYVSSMKLLAPTVGWAQTAHGLLWTEDDGKDWKNITPRQETALPEPFFFDTHRGWVLSVGCSVENPKKLEMGFNLVSTTDSGATWSSVDVSPLTVTDYGNSDGAEVQGCGGDFAFVDCLHGWINVTATGVTMNSRWAFLLTTSDGGKTWKRAAHAPSLPWGELLLVTPSEGWLKAGPGDPRLFVSHDEANSWQKVKVARPSDISKEAWVAGYSLPTFQDRVHGFLPVTYYGGVGVEATTVLFKTTDGGRIWKADRRVAEKEGENYGTSVMIGDAWIFVAQHGRRPILNTIKTGESLKSTLTSTESPTTYGHVRAVSFVTPLQGWVVVANGDLLSSTDGGSTWTDITPGPTSQFLQSSAP